MHTRLALLATLLLAPAAGADEPQATDDPKVAAYHQLSERMQDLAARTAWSGVDRTFLKMLEQELPVTVADYRLAAEAARITGDAAACQARLIAAMELEPQMDTARSLAEIQGNYGRVILVAKDTSPSLVPEQRPFQPDRAKAIDFASASLTASGRFDGLLPTGNYSFGDKTFHVEPGHEPVEILIHKLPDGG